MNSRNLDFADEIMRITAGKGVDIILNSLPAAYISKGMDILAPYGRFVEIGKRDVYADTAVGLKALRKNIQLAVLDLASVGMERPELMKELLAEVNAMLEAGEIAPLPVTSFPVPRVADAFRYMSQAKHIGKVVVTFDQPSADVRVSMERPFRLDARRQLPPHRWLARLRTRRRRLAEPLWRRPHRAVVPLGQGRRGRAPRGRSDHCTRHRG